MGTGTLELQRRATPVVRTHERTVMIVDDHRSYAEALAIAIDVEEGLRCVAIAGTATEGMAAVLRFTPDVVVIDLNLPDGHGHTLMARLHELRADLPVLALTAYADAANVALVAQAGACAFLRKECSVREVIASIRSAGDGPMSIDASTLGAMLTPSVPPRESSDAGGVHLTPREHEVLALLADALDAQAIARRLGVSIHTVRGYLKSLLAKLEAHSQLEAVVRAKRLGLLAR